MPASKKKDTHDGRLQDKISCALKRDNNLSGYDINVRVVNGHITLQGIVDVLADKNHAHGIAATVEGAGEIENNITVSTDGAVTDRDIHREIRQELEGNLHLNDMRVKVTVHQGDVTLTGTAESAAQKQALRETVSKAMGVKSIHNHISISTREEIDSAGLLNEVQRCFIEEGIANTVRVVARKGVITLSGSASIEERNRALKVASKVPGVKRVEAHRVDTSKGELSRAAQAASAVKTAFTEDYGAGKAAIKIYEADGHLVLEGIVPNLEQKSMIDKKLHSLMEEYGREFITVENKIRLTD